MSELIFFLIGLFGMHVIVLILWWPKQDTTDESFWIRSGLKVYVDNKTGVQYVKGGWFGGIHVRLDQDGKPLIEEQGE